MELQALEIIKIVRNVESQAHLRPTESESAFK
jgi:hypothetical protein